MKRLQCTKCEQVFWTELNQIDENQVGGGDWIKNPCPRCGAEWVIVEPKIILRKAAAISGRGQARLMKRKLRSKKRGREGAGSDLKPVEVRRIRKRLGISQKELANLAGVSAGSVVSWERGKFKPKREKIEKLKELSPMSKEDARRILYQKSTPIKEKKKAA